MRGTPTFHVRFPLFFPYKGVLNNCDLQGQMCPGRRCDNQSHRVGTKRPSSKAAAIFSGGAYVAEYVSTEKGRERRWRLFSTDPLQTSRFPSDQSLLLYDGKPGQHPVTQREIFHGLFIITGFGVDRLPEALRCTREVSVLQKGHA